MTSARNKHKQIVLMRYFLKSFFIGLGILVAIWILLLINSKQSVSIDGLSKLHQEDGYLYFIDLVPIILGIYSLVIGLKFYQKIWK